MEYEKCLVELDEILKCLKYEDLIKIPYEVRKAISEKKDKQYKWKYDKSKNLNEQNINRKTIAILSYLNMEYILNKEQKELMEKFHKINEEKAEKEKYKRYDANNIFKKKTIDNKQEELALVEVRSEKLYKKLFLFIKSIFKKS